MKSQGSDGDKQTSATIKKTRRNTAEYNCRIAQVKQTHPEA